MTKSDVTRIAVLIDADNVSYQYIDVIQPELARYGVPTVKRIYGDWTNNNLAGWKPLLQENAIIPVQQFSYTTGKNSSDSALIIDAMDLLYSNVVDSFCLVSSDSDFTRLATRLRESGKTVYGFGETKTPNAFIAACDRFVYLEVLKERQAAEVSDAPEEVTDPTRKERNRDKEARGNTKQVKTGNDNQKRMPNKQTMKLITQCIEDCADDSGWAYLGDVGNMLNNIRPEFDSRNYGFPKLSSLMRFLPRIDMDERPTKLPNVKQIYIRNNK